MRADVLPVPGVLLGAYPERRAARAPTLHALLGRIPGARGVRRYRRFIERVRVLERAAAVSGTGDFAQRLTRLRAAFARDRMTEALIAEAFMLVTRACSRELGLELYDTQLIAARVMLDGQLAEMATGEGKTLAAAVCAATAALAGIPVHVITANDYLVRRDAELLRPLYAALGLAVAAVSQGQAAHARRAAYDADVVYCTAPELVFDYLRDALTRAGARSDLEARVARLAAAPAMRPTVLRGLCMAIVDEADSVLIDDARVPLILSERCTNEAEHRYLARALDLARTLTPDTHYALDRRGMSVELTAAGRQMLEAHAERAPGLDAHAEGALWRNRLHRDETVCTALAALLLYERDRHYIVRDGAVTIVDASTGRLAPGRVWSRGLHRLVELKEGCPPGSDTATVAQITYQRFFRRYLALGGMSGTLREARAELASVYGLSVVRIPLSRPDRRRVLATRLYARSETAWDAAVAEAARVSAAGRPVLIGTDSIAESEALSQRLTAAGAAHAVLNARQDGDEAALVAEAGKPGRITVATNMAGRGTDIPLAPGVAEAGGLHVISCQHNASRRIDRQLVGRCARRGDPGSARIFLALDKPLIASFRFPFLCRLSEYGLERPQWLVDLVGRLPQWLESSRQRRERRELLRRDLRAARESSFARPCE